MWIYFVRTLWVFRQRRMSKQSAIFLIINILQDLRKNIHENIRNKQEVVIYIYIEN